MSDYKLTVGLEIHVELKTKSKMFCTCKNDPFNSSPNANICPVCYGLPGALPVANKVAVESVAKLGKLLGGKINPTIRFARKNYFYADLPKGYQISQLEMPIVEGAETRIGDKKFRIERIHLEEDTAKLTHAPKTNYSLVDFNRSGVPLMELVTKPDFETAEEAKNFCKELQHIVKSLGIAEADMEKGQMRCEANISVSKTDELGTKVEIKNLNSFRSVERAIESEFERQTKALNNGEQIVQETRAWIEASNTTMSMRTKETSADYRYFPEPDLPNIVMNEENIEASDLKTPNAQKADLQAMGLEAELSKQIVSHRLYDLTTIINNNCAYRSLFKKAISLLIDLPEIREVEPSVATEFLIAAAKSGYPKKALQEIITRGKNDGNLEYDFEQLDTAPIVKELVDASPKIVADYKAGKVQAANALIGQLMAKTAGRLDAKAARESIISYLDQLV